MSKNLDSRVREIFPIGNVLLYGSRTLLYHIIGGQFETTELGTEDIYGFAEIRKLNFRRNKNLHQNGDRKVIYGSHK